VPVWSLSCFYVRKGYRRQGVTAALIAAALKAAKRAGAPALEAYPLDADKSPSATGTGYVSTFARAGFETVACRAPPRPIMRHDLKAHPLKHLTDTRGYHFSPNGRASTSNDQAERFCRVSQ